MKTLQLHPIIEEHVWATSQSCISVRLDTVFFALCVSNYIVRRCCRPGELSTLVFLELTKPRVEHVECHLVAFLSPRNRH